MARHARDNRSVGDKRAALAGSRHDAYSHSDQVGGAKRREADGRWVERTQEPPREKPVPLSSMTLGQFIKHNAVYILSVVAVVVIVVFLVIGVRMFTGASDSKNGAGDGVFVGSYDWSNLEYDGDRYAYVVDGQVTSRLGIDVSDYDKEIDWESVAADGIDFVMIRLGYRGATEGGLYLDEYFYDNLKGAKGAGLDRGVYFFSQAISVEEAKEEAEFVLSCLDGASIEYPIAFDSEVVTSLGATRTSQLTSEEITAISDAFCDAIEGAGYRTLVYGNGYDLRSYEAEAMTGRGIWWAEYGAEHPSHDVNIVMWQYTNEGQVAGIANLMDMNLDLYDLRQGRRS